MICLQKHSPLEYFQGCFQIYLWVKHDEENLLWLIRQVPHDQRNGIIKLSNGKLCHLKGFGPINRRQIDIFLQRIVLFSFLLGKIMNF